MSRSYKKPWVTDGQRRSKTRHNRKKEASRNFRRKSKKTDVEIPDGNPQKRGMGFNSWDISDFRFFIKKRDHFYKKALRK